RTPCQGERASAVVDFFDQADRPRLLCPACVPFRGGESNRGMTLPSHIACSRRRDQRPAVPDPRAVRALSRAGGTGRGGQGTATRTRRGPNLPPHRGATPPGRVTTGGHAGRPGGRTPGARNGAPADRRGRGLATGAFPNLSAMGSGGPTGLTRR